MLRMLDYKLFIYSIFFTVLLGACNMAVANNLNDNTLTVASFNMGGIPIPTTYHPDSPTATSYDYIESLTSNELMRERYAAEPKQLELILKIQEVALQRCFGEGDTQRRAERTWEAEDYQSKLEELMDPVNNKPWYEKNGQKLPLFWDVQKAVHSDTPIDITITDDNVRRQLSEFLDIADSQITPGSEFDEIILNKRKEIAKRIFSDELSDADIITLLEYNDFAAESPLSLDEYDVQFKSERFVTTGIAWKKERFEFVREIGRDELVRSYSVLLRDRLTNKTIAVGALHPVGCNPFLSNAGSKTGDETLKTALKVMETAQADLMIVGTDANVTPTHPRLGLFAEAGYKVDPSFFYPTATNPVDFVDTKIDYIAVKGGEIQNLPVLSVGLNSMRTNISDHKPLKAKIRYPDSE